MNNPSNNPRHQDPSNPARNNIPNEFFMGQGNRPPLDLLDKTDPKMGVNELNDLFMNNFLKNPQSFNQLFDKGGPNPEFFNAQGGNAPNLPFDPNLLYNFPNMGSNKGGSTAAQSEAMNYFPNMGQMGQMGGNFLPMHNFGLNNPDLYGELLKNPNQNQLNQLELPDKNMFNPNMLAENPGLMDNQFLLNNLDEFNFKPQDGQAPKMNNQGQNMPGLGQFPNPMLFGPYGGDLGLNSFLFPPMANFPFEEFYNMQMQGGVPPGGMPHNIGNLPMDLKVENQQTYQKNQQQPNAPASTKNAAAARTNPTEPSQQTPRGAEQQQQKPNPANAFGNSQDLSLLNGMGMPPGMPGMGMPGMPGMPGLQGMQGMSGKSMGLGGMGGMFNFPMQSLGFPKDMEPQSMLKYMTEGLNPGSQPPQENPASAKNPNQNPLPTNPNAGAGKDPLPSAKGGQMGEEMKTAGVSMENKQPQASALTNPDMDILGKSLLDPFLMNNPAMKKGSYLDGFGFEDQGFLEASSNLFNKMKEKNKYERSLKIERYKNKKRNWQKKIAYDCRKRVADTRLRIKGRFISKKDSEKIQQLVGKQEEAFNDKKNLNLEYLTNKFNISGENEDGMDPMSGKPSVSKGFLLHKIDEIFHTNKNPLPPKNLAMNHKSSEIIRSHLNAGSKKIFKIKNRRDGEDLLRNDFLNGAGPLSMKQNDIIKNPLKLKNEAFPDFPNLGNLANMPGMPGMPNMQGMPNMPGMPGMPPMNMDPSRMKNGGFPFPGAPEGFEMPTGQEMEHPMLGNMNMNMLAAMANYMGDMGMGMPMNMGMGMPMNIGGFENRPELQQGENGGHDMQRFK